MRVLFSLGLFVAFGSAAFLVDGGRWHAGPVSTDNVVTGSVSRATPVYQAVVEGERVRCWLNASRKSTDYRFVGAECGRLGIEQIEAASVGVERTGDLEVTDKAGKTLLHFFSADGDGWEAAPETGQLIDLIATSD